MGDTDGNSLDDVTPRKRGRPKGSLGGEEKPVPPRIEKLRASRPGHPKRTKQTTITLFEGDFEIIDFIKESLGTTSISETIRASIRAYAMHLERLLNK